MSATTGLTSGVAAQPSAPTGDFWFRRPPNSLQVMEPVPLAESLAAHIVELFREGLSRRPYLVVTTSSGRTLRPAYARLREQYRSAVEWSRIVCVQMDEYLGIGAADPRSTAFELQHEFIEPLGIGRFIRFQDSAGVASCTPAEFEQQVLSLGGIDCAVHGVGRNGHIGFNEPGAPAQFVTRTVTLAESTRIANGVDFRMGVTLGLGVLGNARVSVVVLRGAEKRSAAEALLFHPVGPENPVGHLRSCAQVSVYIDRDAAPPGL